MIFLVQSRKLGDGCKQLRTYEILMTLVSDRICELCSRLSPHNSSGVLSRSFQGQTLNVAVVAPLTGSHQEYAECVQGAGRPAAVRNPWPTPAWTRPQRPSGLGRLSGSPVAETTARKKGREKGEIKICPENSEGFGRPKNSVRFRQLTKNKVIIKYR